jgi:hypothetical protein
VSSVAAARRNPRLPTDRTEPVAPVLFLFPSGTKCEFAVLGAARIGQREESVTLGEGWRSLL